MSHKAILHIYSTFNNVLITATAEDVEGEYEVIIWLK